MSATDSDTIAAIATAQGAGGIGIVRLSGPRARLIAERICA
jgi:tRNA modification GTPase